MDVKTTVLNRYRAAKQWRETHSFAGASIQKWLDRTHRMYNELHHPEHVEQVKRRLGIDLTTCGYYAYGRLKVDAARAYVDGTYQHAIDAPFTFEPRRNPELNDDQRGEAAMMTLRLAGAQLAAVAGNWSDIWDGGKKAFKGEATQKWIIDNAQKMAQTLNNQSFELASEACEFRKGLIADQLDAGGWRMAWPLMVHHLIADPYAVVAAREYRSIPTLKWNGTKPVRTMAVAPTCRSIDPRNVYIGSDATSAQDGSGVTELTVRTRGDLISLYKTEDETIDKPALLEAIALIKTDSAENNWLGVSQILNEMETHSLIHQGLFSGKELAMMGKTGVKPDLYYNCTVEICQNKVIRFECLDFDNNARNYYSASHAKTSATYASECPLTKLYTVENQIQLAVALRDRNYAMSSGPMFTMHAGYFDRPQDVSYVPYARAVANPDRSGQASKGFEQTQIESQYITQDNHIENLKKQGDEICGIVSGLQGLARSGLSRTTLGGAVLDQTAGERMMTAAILNMDRTIIEPMVEHLDNDNMLDNSVPKEYRRGDIKVIGKGISGLREVEMRGRLVAEGLPVAMQLAQQGLVPKEALQDASKQYLSGKGFNTSGMPSAASRREINNTLPKQTSDGRTFNPQQDTTGVAQ